MKKKWLAVLATVLILCLCVSLIGCKGCGKKKNGEGDNPETPGNTTATERTAPGTIDYLFTQYEGFSYTAPSVLTKGNDVLLSYTTNTVKNSEDTVIAVRSGNVENGKYTFGEQRTAVGPSAGKWDSHNLGNSDIIGGNFTYGGTAYNYLMAYEATSVAAEKRFQIGLAVSVDGTAWVKVGTTPFVSYDYAAYGDTAGVRYPSLVNVNGAGDILLFYAYADSLVTETRFTEVRAGNLDDVQMSGDIAVPNKGLPLDGNEWGVVVNADFAYDRQTDEIYMVKDGFPYTSVEDKKASKVEIAKIERALLYEQEAAWTTVVATLDGIDAGGYTRLHSACFVTDAFGGIASDALSVFFTSGVVQKNATDQSYKFGNGLHAFSVPTALREDIDE